MRPILLSNTSHKFSVAKEEARYTLYVCDRCQIAAKRFGVSEAVFVKDEAPLECNSQSKGVVMPRTKKTDMPIDTQQETAPGEQSSAFEKDELDPQIAKVADRVVELLITKKTTDDNLKVQKRNFIGMMNKSGKDMIRHRGMEIKVRHVAEKDQLTIKQLKPIDGIKAKPKRVP